MRGAWGFWRWAGDGLQASRVRSYLAHLKGQETLCTLRGADLHTQKSQIALLGSKEPACMLGGAALHAQGNCFACLQGKELAYLLRGAK